MNKWILGAIAFSQAISLGVSVKAAEEKTTTIMGIQKVALPLLNNYILQELKSAPDGGEYAQNSAAAEALKAAVKLNPNSNLTVDHAAASPSFCSGASYLVFLGAIARIQRENSLYSEQILSALLPRGQDDGVGAWGKFNANGPGVARLFFLADIGFNFVEYEKARPGDFLKIFWNDQIGKNERGHQVIYLGSKMINGEPYVRYWSSNSPDGRSERTIPRSKIYRAVFSRFSKPKNLKNILTIPARDFYLASLLTKDSTEEEMWELIGINDSMK